MKSWPTAFFASAIVLAAAIVFASFNAAESQGRGAGFMMASGSAAYGWRINTTTGAVSYCVRRTDSTDPVYLSENAPTCSAFTKPVE